MKTLIRSIIALLLFAFAYVVVLAVPKQAIMTERLPVTSTPADLGLAFEDITLSPRDGELNLAGWWIPAPNPRATMVFIHGGGSNRTSDFFGSLKFYRAMVDHGISVVAVDLRNHGESSGDGHGLQFGRTEKYDAEAAAVWARHKTPGLPIVGMGISMGGATLIQAAGDGAEFDGLILLDSLLDTHDTFKQGAMVATGLPPALFALSAWAATQFHGLPGGAEQALSRALALDIPVLAIQDPDDPVTRARYSLELAQHNRNVTLWMAPAIDPQHADLAWKQRWGTHVSAFLFYPEQTVSRILGFIDTLSPQLRADTRYN